MESLIDEVDLIECDDETFELYRNTYRTLLKNMIAYELSSIEVDDLLCVANLNPEEYGDVVYWARGILDHRYELTTYEKLNM